MNISMRARKRIDFQAVEVLVTTSHPTYAVMSNIEFKKPQEGVGLDSNSFISLRDLEAQVLMDDLWACGVRPTEGAGSAGAMRRAEAHITDLQKVAFTLLDAVTKKETKGIK